MLPPETLALLPGFNGLAPYLATGAAFLLGVLLTWLFLRTRLSTERARHEERRRADEKSVAELQAGRARLESEVQQLRHTELKLLKNQGELETLVESQRRATAEKQQLLEAAEARMAQAFKTISHESLRNSQEQFLNLARTALQTQQDEARGEIDQRRQAVERMVRPVAESLQQVQTRLGELEKARQGAYASLHEQVRQLIDAQHNLQGETSQLVRALRQPSGRSRWGDMQLRRVVELSGLIDYCSFLPAEETEDGHPDLLVQLPGGQHIVVDTGAPLDAYLDALDATDEAGRHAALDRHARQLDERLDRLASAGYREQLEVTPEFVVLFVPSESILAAALTEDGRLLDKGLEQGVMLATPTTLMALLRAVAYGWRHESLANDAKRIVEVGGELHARVRILTEQFADLGESLDGAVRHYNEALGSIEGRVLPTTRQLESLGAAPEFAALPGGLPSPTSPRQPADVSRTDFVETPDSLADTGEVPEDDFEGFAAEEEEPAAGIEEPKARKGVVEQLKRAAEALSNGSRTAEIEEDDFEGFTEEVAPENEAAEAETAPVDQEPDAEGAADDLRAALGDSKTG